MDKQAVRDAVWEAVMNSQLTPEELCALLEIQVEDLLRKFPRKLVENAEKFGVYPQEEDSDEGEEGSREGFSTYEPEA